MERLADWLKRELKLDTVRYGTANAWAFAQRKRTRAGH
ncbi:hypothetical protein PAPH110629_15295 [Paenibacillus phoenicis]